MRDNNPDYDSHMATKDNDSLNFQMSQSIAADDIRISYRKLTPWGTKYEVIIM